MRRLRCRCPAKVNVHLEVLGRRSDGYHEVRTLLMAVGLFDELVAEEAPPGVVQLEVEGPAPVADNIILRAAELLQQTSGASFGARLFLRKRIPVAAGLGGGSSNGAAALVVLSRLWGLPLSWEALFPLAAALGSDVPYFLLGGLCWGVGRGEEVYPLPDPPPWWVVLVPGREAVSTATVYQSLAAGPCRPFRQATIYHWLLRGGQWPFAVFANDLQAAVVSGYPWVGEELTRLRAFGPLLAMVSGSGGTVFGLFPSEHEARQAAEALRERGALAVPVLGRRRSALLRPR